ncbi:hypothetical protein BLA29_007370, partial [Euroglyphus maynei]
MPKIIVSPSPPSSVSKRSSPIILSSSPIISKNECSNTVQHQSPDGIVRQLSPLSNTQNKSKTKPPQQYLGQPLVVNDVQFIRQSLPSIVEQSLNRYVANNNIAESSQQTSSSLQQIEPIDLSSKKSQSNNDNNNFGTPEKPKRSSPTFLSTSPSKSLNQQSPQRQQSTAKLVAEQMRQSFSPLSQMMIEPSSNIIHNHNNTTNAHQLYQNVRREEFAHLTPGIQSPHSLPRVIMMNHHHNGIEANNNHNKSSSSPKQSSPPSIGKSPTKYFDGVGVGGGKPTCPTCMKKFNKPEQLRLHYKIHSFERLFRCESCGVSFRTKGHLQKHARSLSHMNKLNMSITFGRPSSDNPRPFKC